MNLVLQRVDDNELIRRIDAAKSSVALHAPGVSAAVALLVKIDMPSHRPNSATPQLTGELNLG